MKSRKEDAEDIVFNIQQMIDLTVMLETAGKDASDEVLMELSINYEEARTALIDQIASII